MQLGVSKTVQTIR